MQQQQQETTITTQYSFSWYIDQCGIVCRIDQCTTKKRVVLEILKLYVQSKALFDLFFESHSSAAYVHEKNVFYLSGLTQGIEWIDFCGVFAAHLMRALIWLTVGVILP